MMPKRFSHRWWKLWYSGAIDREVTFLDYLADELEIYCDTTPDVLSYTDINPRQVRRGELLSCADAVPRPFLDLGARCAQDLRLNYFKVRTFDNAFTKLIGMTAHESDKRWR